MSMLLNPYRFPAGGGGGTVSQVSLQSTGSTANGTTFNIPFGSHTYTAGNRVTMEIVARRNSSPTTGITINTPTGWTLIQSAVADNNLRLGVYELTGGATGSEGGTNAVDTSFTLLNVNGSITARVRQWSGATAGTCEFATDATDGTASTDPITPPALTPAAGGSISTGWVTGVVWANSDSGSTVTEPSGYGTAVVTKLLAPTSTNNNAGTLATAMKIATAASETPGAFTSYTGTGLALFSYTMAVR